MTNLLTETLTDLFEMEQRPEDPLVFLHKKIGDKIVANGGKLPGTGGAGGAEEEEDTTTKAS